MAVNSSKYTLGMVFRRLNSILGIDLEPNEESPHFRTRAFIEACNMIVREMAAQTQMLHRLNILLPSRDWLRYIKLTSNELNNGMIRIDLEGQTATLLSDNDPACLDWQYENVCDGDGVDPDYAGTSIPPIQAPDSFPKIYLPAECNIPVTLYGTNAGGIFVAPQGNQHKINTDGNEPLVPQLFDMRVVGYGSVTPGSDGYPTTGNLNSYFIDPYLIYALRLIEYNPAVGSTATDYAIPQSADAYLNSTWAEILDLDGTGTAGVLGAGTFVIDGVTYTVSVLGAAWNTATDDGFTLVITDGTGTWQYQIIPSYTPWQCVGCCSTRWGGLFQGQALYGNRAWYIKVDDMRLKLPDDLWKIKWLWKLPKSTWYYDVPEDATEDTVLSNLSDNETLMMSMVDEAAHLFPMTEGLFTKAKLDAILSGASDWGAGYYTQVGQQLRIVPKTDDVYALYYIAKPDLLDATTDVEDFDSIYMEIPGVAVEAMIYRLAADWYGSSKGGDINLAQYYLMHYEKAKADAMSLYGGRGGQQMDAPQLQQTLMPRRRQKYFGSLTLGEP